jgi:hypothetical protein
LFSQVLDRAQLVRHDGMEAIRQAAATLEHAQQNELPDEFVSLFRADTRWTAQ